jgi:YggT family protein
MPTITALVSFLFRVYSILILVRVLLTWVSISPYHPAVRILHQVTDPVILPLRRLIPPVGGTVDVSPIAALILLEILHRVVVSFLGGF